MKHLAEVSGLPRLCGYNDEGQRQLLFAGAFYNYLSHRFWYDCFTQMFWVTRNWSMAMSCHDVLVY